MKDYFTQLFAYNAWANERLLTILIQHQVEDEYCVQMFSHLLNAQYIWHRRLTAQANDYKIWDKWTWQELQTAFAHNQQLWLYYIAQLTTQELARSFTYQNSAGDSFENIVQDCLVHLVNHATYHRAQVAKRLRDIGIIPPNTDFITYCRELFQA